MNEIELEQQARAAEERAEIFAQCGQPELAGASLREAKRLRVMATMRHRGWPMAVTYVRLNSRSCLPQC
jgi:hypothetical protein